MLPPAGVVDAFEIRAERVISGSFLVVLVRPLGAGGRSGTPPGTVTMIPSRQWHRYSAGRVKRTGSRSARTRTADPPLPDRRVGGSGGTGRDPRRPAMTPGPK